MIGYHISKNLKLVPLTESDSETIEIAVNSNRERLAEYLPWVDGVTDTQTASNYITERINSGQPDSQWFKIIFQERFSGVFAVKYVEPKTFIAELGYWLTKCAQGHRLISKIIDCLPQILEGYGVQQIEFRCLNDNKASIAIAKRTGATFVKSVPFEGKEELASQKLNIYRVAFNRL